MSFLINRAYVRRFSLLARPQNIYKQKHRKNVGRKFKVITSAITTAIFQCAAKPIKLKYIYMHT